MIKFELLAELSQTLSPSDLETGHIVILEKIYVIFAILRINHIRIMGP